MTPGELPMVNDRRARVAIDLGAESCRVSLLRWDDEEPRITEVHRIPNGPIECGASLRWPLSRILSGVEEGLHKAATEAPEGIASIAVDGWAVDYVRLDPNGLPIHDPFCYRDERTVEAKQKADEVLSPEEAFRRTGAQPLRIDTLYQLLADPNDEKEAPWVCLPEYVLHWLGAPRVAEYTNATHTGLVDIATGDWARHTFEQLEIPIAAAPCIVAPGTR
ncbi:MAG: FGGY family carbohydrate kinase, partial [Terracidiphilus sp.]